MTNPFAAGFRQPEESAPHERTFMQWPVSLDVYTEPGDLEAVQEKIALIADTIARFEPVVLLAGKAHHGEIGEWVTNSNIELWDIATDDLWCRDSGPLFLLNDRYELAAANLNFNGWGNKQVHGNDGRIAERLCEMLGVKLFNNGLVGEAGGAEFDGVKNLIAHESSWVNANRNAGSRDEITERLKQVYGASEIYWAPGLAGADITDYHIDSLARFTGPDEIVIQLPEVLDEADPWSMAAYETYRILSEVRFADQTGFGLAILPEPSSIRSANPDFVPSYVNYHVCNGAVIAPQFGDDSTDQEAMQTLSSLYPGREIVMLDIDALAEAGGGIHCATQQQPKSSAIWKG